MFYTDFLILAFLLQYNHEAAIKRKIGVKIIYGRTLHRTLIETWHCASHSCVAITEYSVLVEASGSWFAVLSFIGSQPSHFIAH